jgi:hypothetical protein
MQAPVGEKDPAPRYCHQAQGVASFEDETLRQSPVLTTFTR